MPNSSDITLVLGPGLKNRDNLERMLAFFPKSLPKCSNSRFNTERTALGGHQTYLSTAGDKVICPVSWIRHHHVNPQNTLRKILC